MDASITSVFKPFFLSDLFFKKVLTCTQKNIDLPFIPLEQLQSKEENVPIVLGFWASYQ